MLPFKRKSSIVGISVSVSAGMGFVLELFASREMPFGSGLIIGGLIGFLFGHFIRLLGLTGRQR